MQNGTRSLEAPNATVVLATGEAPIFEPGDGVRVLTRSPFGHYRVPTCSAREEGRRGGRYRPLVSTTKKRRKATTPG